MEAKLKKDPLKTPLNLRASENRILYVWKFNNSVVLCSDINFAEKEEAHGGEPHETYSITSVPKSGRAAACTLQILAREPLSAIQKIFSTLVSHTKPDSHLTMHT